MKGGIGASINNGIEIISGSGGSIISSAHQQHRHHRHQREIISRGIEKIMPLWRIESAKASARRARKASKRAYHKAPPRQAAARRRRAKSISISILKISASRKHQQHRHSVWRSESSEIAPHAAAWHRAAASASASHHQARSSAACISAYLA